MFGAMSAQREKKNCRGKKKKKITKLAPPEDPAWRRKKKKIACGGAGIKKIGPSRGSRSENGKRVCFTALVCVSGAV